MRTPWRSLATALLSAAAAGCGETGFGGACVVGPCPPDGRAEPRTYLLGFPIDRVDRSALTADGGARATLRVGESVRLIAVRSLDVLAAPAETLRTGLTWALRDSVAASIAAGAQGTGRLDARAPGLVGLVLVNGLSRELWSCDGTGCWRIGEAVVVP